MITRCREPFQRRLGLWLGFVAGGIPVYGSSRIYARHVLLFAVSFIFPSVFALLALAVHWRKLNCRGLSLQSWVC